MRELENTKLIDLAINDPRKIIESLFYIVDKTGKRVPFVLTPIQDKYYREMSPRDDILKARKHGISSLILAIFTVKFLWVPNTVNVCVSHTETDTGLLFDKVLYYLDNLPFKVKLEKSSAERLRIGEKNSDFIIGTAGSKTFGRGSTIHNLHLSEFAFYPKWEMVTGLINAVGDDTNSTYIVKESTANGYGNTHHLEWLAEKRGDSVFKPHFFGWHENPEYYREPDEDFEPTIQELALKEKYNLSEGQLAWRRWKINSMQQTQDYNKEEQFKQEFPINDTEAFLSTGRPYFNPQALDYYLEVFCKKPEARGQLVGWDPPIFSSNEVGELKIYEKPEPNRQYVIGGDTSSGGDYSALVVLSRDKMEEVALWHGKADEYELAAQAYKLGTYYNNALVGIERNNMGVAVVKKLDELGYTQQYQTEVLDELGNKVKDKLGWETNSKTRPIMLTALGEAISERKIIIRSDVIIGECKSFIRNERGKVEAQTGAHDDLVVALAIALQMYYATPSDSGDDDVFVRDYRPNTTLYKFKSNK